MCAYVSMLLCGERFVILSRKFWGTNDITLRNIVVSLTCTVSSLLNNPKQAYVHLCVYALMW
jgi:hypothetical protein